MVKAAFLPDDVKDCQDARPFSTCRTGCCGMAIYTADRIAQGEQGPYFVTGSRKGEMLRQSAQNRKGGLHTTARPSRSG